jgi:crotonobetainyl-CoA:carnitine CoA-transferase CaiB-like acyl-CoA transferase
MSALDGLRVVELTHGMAGELAGMVLADNGAQVVKVEPPGGLRGRERAGFLVWNRGKHSMVADLATGPGRALLDDLVRNADVVIEDLRPATVARLGVGYGALRAVNPELVYVAITGFGERGPLRDLPGYEYIVAAKSGRMADQATIAGDRPAFTPTPIASYGAAMLAVQGALAALYRRTRGGSGCRVHTSLAHALVTVDMTSGHGHRVHHVDTSGRVYGVMPLAFMTARCRDGRYLQMCSRFPHHFRNWMRVLGLSGIYDDPAYAQVPDVLPSQRALDDLVASVRERMARRTLDEWLDIFSAQDVGANPFLAPREFLRCEQALVTGTVAAVEDPDRGTLVQIGPIAHLSATPARIGPGAPRLGGTDPATFAWSPRPAVAAADGVPPAPPGGRPARYPLDGVLVVELGFAYAAPHAMTLLGELGARVVKVEPPTGDPARRNWTTAYGKELQGKQSVVADLKTPEGREIVRRLAARADVLLHNFRPGVPEKLGVDYETMRGLNPRLVYVYGSCYGSTGPWAHLPGFHSSPNAIAGTGVVEAGDGNPPRNRTFGDPAGAFALAASTLLALCARDRTGQGLYVEGTMLAALGYAVSDRGVTGGGVPEVAGLDPDQRGLGTYQRLYETADGWLALCCGREEERSALRRVLAEAAGPVPPPEGPAGWEPGEDDVRRWLGRVFAAGTAEAWQERLLAAGVPAVRADDVNFFDFMLRGEHMRANGLSIEEDIEPVGRIWRSSGCVEFSHLPTRTGAPAPLGAATAAVLAELGYCAAQIEALGARGVTRAVGQGLPG